MNGPFEHVSGLVTWPLVPWFPDIPTLFERELTDFQVWLEVDDPRNSRSAARPGP
ncbi:hypothetical protein GCM10027168_72190 [Streptomyces capparidis]